MSTEGNNHSNEKRLTGKSLREQELNALREKALASNQRSKYNSYSYTFRSPEEADAYFTSWFAHQHHPTTRNNCNNVSDTNTINHQNRMRRSHSDLNRSWDNARKTALSSFEFAQDTSRVLPSTNHEDDPHKMLVEPLLTKQFSSCAQIVNRPTDRPIEVDADLILMADPIVTAELISSSTPSVSSNLDDSETRSRSCPHDDSQQKKKKHPKNYSDPIAPSDSVATPSNTYPQRWKDHIFDCFKYGLCHPSLLYSCFIPLGGIAQVLYRIVNNQRRKLIIFWLLTIFVLFHFSLHYWLSLQLEQACRDQRKHMQRSCRKWIQIESYLSYIYIGCTILLVAWTRHFVRKRYRIPPLRGQHNGSCCPRPCCRFCCCCCCCCCFNDQSSVTTDTHIPHYPYSYVALEDPTTSTTVSATSSSCDDGWMEDCCCSLLCTSCVTSQLMRQTANYGLYRASCCSYSGLPPQVSNGRDYHSNEEVEEENVPPNYL